MERKAAVAGGFYPSNPKDLRAEIAGYINNAVDFEIDQLKAIIVPHAGYIYSGPVAGFAYRQLRKFVSANPGKKNIFILGPAHFIYTTASIGIFDAFITPLGKVKVNKTLCENLQQDMIFDRSPEAHLPEHSIEVQLPFLQECLPDFEIVPILLGEINIEALANILQPYFGQDNNIFVISSDLSHYLPYEKAKQTDRKSLKAIIDLKTESEENHIDACGHAGIETAMALAKKAGAKVRLLDYRNSGDTAGDKDAVVGYASLTIY